MDNSFSIFGLTLEQTKVLFSLQKQIVVDDIVNKTPANYQNRMGRNESRNNVVNDVLKSFNLGKKRVQPFKSSDDLSSELDNVISTKHNWARIWEENVKKYLRGVNQGSEINLYSSMNEIKYEINRLNESIENTFWKYLILLECCTFSPYLPKDKQQSDYNNLKKCEFYDNTDSLVYFSEILGVDSKYVELFRTDHDKAIKRLSGFWKKMAISTGIGISAALASVILFQPYVLFAAPGLSGAAAVTSGLATLGGGAIAAGGFGMAGGMAVVIGGGTLLGVGAGSSAGLMIAKMSTGAVLSESAKMEVILKDIVLGAQKDIRYFQEILIKITQQEQQLREEIIRLQIEGAKYKKEIEELEKKLDYLEKLVVGSRTYSCVEP